MKFQQERLVRCLAKDGKMEIKASFLRSFTVIFYIVHIIFLFHTDFITPPTRVFARGVLVEDGWALAKRYLSSYFLIDILAVLPLPQVLGAYWYLVCIERETMCWKEYCDMNTALCSRKDMYCDTGGRQFNKTAMTAYLSSSCPILKEDKILFDFGIFLDGLQSGIVRSSTDFHLKLFYCFWWGFQNLSSIGQNLKTSTDVWKICFAVFISGGGSVLFTLLVGNMQGVFSVETF